MRKFIKYLTFNSFLPIVLTLLLFCSPKRPLPKNLIQIFYDWYILPTQDKTNRLLSYGLDIKQLDSLYKLLKNSNSKPGPQIIVLPDTLQQNYKLGFTTPKEFRPDTVYPLIIYLHGGVGVQAATKGEKAWDMLAPLADSLQLFIASPSANRLCRWWEPCGIRRILQTLRYMQLFYPIDKNKIFLAGVSDGAIGCYAAATTISAHFAGFIAISGFGGILTQLGFPLFSENLSSRPIYNVNAGLDDRYPIKEVEKFISELKLQGIPVILKVYPEEKHGFDYREKEFGQLTQLLRIWQKPLPALGISLRFLTAHPFCAQNILDYEAVKNTNQFPSFGAFWWEDTLIVAAKNLKSIVIYFEQNHTMQIYIRKGKSSVVILKPLPLTAPLALKFILCGYAPSEIPKAIYKINFI